MTFLSVMYLKRSKHISLEINHKFYIFYSPFNKLPLFELRSINYNIYNPFNWQN